LDWQIEELEAECAEKSWTGHSEKQTGVQSLPDELRKGKGKTPGAKPGGQHNPHQSKIILVPITP
jgi:hypothetical protein